MAFPIIAVSFQNCDSQELRVSTSRSGYPKKRTLPLTEDFCLIVSKMRKICKDTNRAKALEEHYKYETPLTGGNKHLDCAIVRGEIHLKLHQCYVSLPRSQCGAPLSPKRWAKNTLQSRPQCKFNCKSSWRLAWKGCCEICRGQPPRREGEKTLNIQYLCQSLLSQVFLKDPYYQKMVRDRKMSGYGFFGAAGGVLGLCLGLSAMSVVEISYHVLLLIVAICRGREMSHEHYE